MSVPDVASRFNMTRFRVYQLSRARGSKAAIFQRLYISHARFEITMASIAAYEVYLQSLNDAHARNFRPVRPMDLGRGVTA